MLCEGSKHFEFIIIMGIFNYLLIIRFQSFFISIITKIYKFINT